MAKEEKKSLLPINVDTIKSSSLGVLYGALYEGGTRLLTASHSWENTF